MTEQSKRSPLPDHWIERIFARMQGLYGSLWLDRWRSGELEERAGQRFDRGLLLAKATWADELGGFVQAPERIARALEACRHRPLPPTLPEFLELCRQSGADAPKRLPAPDVSPEVVSAMQARAAEAVSHSKDDPLAWAMSVPKVRDVWAKTITDLAEAGDERFLAILGTHVDGRVIKSERAMGIVRQWRGIGGEHR